MRILFALVVCSLAHAEVMPQFQEQYDAFIAEYHSYRQAHPDFSVEIDSLRLSIDGGLQDKDADGQCRLGEKDGVIRIVVDDTGWPKFTRLEREKLIFHELGHCVLKRDHLKKKDESGVPVSLMYPGVRNIPDDRYREHRGAYVEELFLGAEAGIEGLLK